MSPTRRSSLLAALAVYAIVVPVVALLPGGAFGVTTPDKLLHALAYGAFTALLLAARFPRGIGPGGAVALSVLHGAAVEGLQAFVPWRRAEWGDLLADGTGAAIAAALFVLVTRWVGSRREGEAA